MNRTLFVFQWPVVAGGYYWAPGRELVRGTKPHGPIRDFLQFDDDASRPYKPFEEATGLFRTFAETPETKQGIADFANRYGLLGKTVLIEPSKTAATKQKEEPGKIIPRRIEIRDVKQGESLPAWVKEIRAMRKAVELWQHGKDNRRRDRLINEHLSGRVVNEHPEQRISVQLLSGATRRRSHLQLVPHTLAIAMWLQLAQAIDGDKKFRRCAHCRKWYAIEERPGQERFYCSDACRFRAYRRRKKRAQRSKAKSVKRRNKR